MPLEGLKNYIAAAVTAMLNGAVAFGIDLTGDQRVAVLGLVNTVIVPVVWIVLRKYTTGPAASFFGGDK